MMIDKQAKTITEVPSSASQVQKNNFWENKNKTQTHREGKFL